MTSLRNDGNYLPEHLRATGATLRVACGAMNYSDDVLARQLRDGISMSRTVAMTN